MFGLFKNDPPPPRPGSASIIPQGLERLCLGGVVSIDEVIKVITSDRFSIPAEMAETYGLDPAFVKLTKLQVAFPAQEQIIIAHSATPWNKRMILRYYLSHGAGMIQVVTDTKGKLICPTVDFFSLLCEEQPSDMSLWLPVSHAHHRQNTWWIGNAAYPLPGIPLDDQGDWAQWSYRRSWEPDPSQHVVTPRNLNEFIHQENGQSQVLIHHMMAYHRPPAALVLQGKMPPYGPISEQNLCEQMILTADRQDGQDTIRTWVGVELSIDDLRL
jgi:hypothetical protein